MKSPEKLTEFLQNYVTKYFFVARSGLTPITFPQAKPGLARGPLCPCASLIGIHLSINLPKQSSIITNRSASYLRA